MIENIRARQLLQRDYSIWSHQSWISWRYQIPRNWLVWEWLLNWNALDSSWYWNNWTPTNVIWAATDIWYQAQCWSFNWSAYINLASSSAIDLSWNNWTICFIVKPTLTWWDRWIIWKKTSFGNLNWEIWKQSANKLVMWIWNSLWWWVIDWNYTFTNNKIVNCVITRNWTSFSLYIDWVFINTQTNSATISNTLPATIWRIWTDVTTGQWSWDIQLIRNYNKSLSQGEIQLLHLELLKLLH